MLRDSKGKFLHGHICMALRDTTTGQFVKSEGEPLPDLVPRFGSYLTIEEEVDIMLSKRKLRTV